MFAIVSFRFFLFNIHSVKQTACTFTVNNKSDRLKQANRTCQGHCQPHLACCIFTHKKERINITHYYAPANNNPSRPLVNLVGTRQERKNKRNLAIFTPLSDSEEQEMATPAKQQRNQFNGPVNSLTCKLVTNPPRSWIGNKQGGVTWRAFLTVNWGTVRCTVC